MSAYSTSQAGDSNAAQQRFLSLFLRSEREIFRYVAVLVPNVLDAEEIVQQTAMALWEKFDAYDPRQPFTPWACRFALNKTRQWIERRQRWQALLDGGFAEEQRMLVVGYYYDRTTIETLAQRSGRSEAATYKMLQRIRHALQLCVESRTQPEVA